MSNPTQASPFCGREDDLKHLQDVWHKVEQGEPQVVVLLAESGLGKTRLVQEFYNWLSVEKDGIGNDGYWPDVLTQKSENLAVNPDISGCNDANVMPYLWWALRLINPEGRNQLLTSTVSAHVPMLSPHLEHMYRSKRTKQRWLESGKTIGESFIGFIPVVGNIIPPAFQLFQQARDAIQDKKQGLEELEAQSRQDINERIVDDLRQVLAKQKKDDAIIPAVIVIDDAQFSTADIALTDLVDKLLTTSLEEKWPVMFMFTHWEREWLEHVAVASPSVAKRVHVLCQKHFDIWKPYKLEAIHDDGLAPSLKQRMPGLINDQVAQILKRVDGNPRFLEEIILYLPRFFTDKDPTKALNDKGLKEMLEKSTSLHDLVQARFEDVPKDVRHTLSVSSLQGMRLLPMLCNTLVQELEKRGEQVLQDSNTTQALRDAENPYTFLNFSGEGLAEFCQRVFYEVAHEGLEDVVDADEAQDAFFSVLRKLADDNVLEELPAVEQDVLLDLTAEALEKSDDEIDRSYALDALLKLIEQNLAIYNYQSAEAIAQRVLHGVEQNKWTLETVEFWQLDELRNALEIMGNLNAAKTIAIEMQRQSAKSPKIHRDLFASYLKIADIQKTQGQLDNG